MITNEAVSTSALLLNVFVKLGLVLLLIYSGAIVLRRRQNSGHPLRRKQIQVLETTHLSPHRALHLVRVGDQTYLIGATDQNIQLLSQIEAADSLVAEKEETPHSLALPDFATLFLQSLHKLKVKP
ncbi:MAG: flagellar biosynthetic protein FliO [Anaerolineales bacterium]|nr:flagellar biosynthetic protein FliO [Anaerolineales bacterium]